MKEERSTERDARRKAELKMRELYYHLEKSTKRHRPEVFIPYMSSLFRKSLENFNRTKIPPHFILRSIEANCAFWKEGYDEQIDRNKMAKIINLYIDYDNPVLVNVIHKNLDLTFLMMWREQVLVQKRPNSNYMARTWRLFVNNSWMKRIAKEFEAKYSVTMDDWFKLCFLCYVIAVNDTSSCINIESVESCDFITIDKRSIGPYLELTCTKPKEVKEKFLEHMKEPLEYHFLNKYIFMERPILDLGNCRLIAPNPNFLMLNAGEGLYQLSSDIAGFDTNFGKSFQSYTEELLGCIENKVNFIKSEELERLASGKSCDFLLEFEDHLLLIECKATSLTVNKLTENAILNNNSTVKIAEGIVQIYATAHDICRGIFGASHIENKKPIFGIVVTFGEIPLVNTDWYNGFIWKRKEEELKSPIYPNEKIKGRPIVVSISTLEEIASYINSSGVSFADLYEEKASLPPHRGDWNAFMPSKISEIKEKIKKIPLLVEQNRDFYASLGVSEEKTEEIQF